MKKEIGLIVLLCVSVLCFGYAEEGFKVVDGDSLERGKERIRLQDIDAPEFMQKCYDADGHKYRCGVEATRFLRALVKKGIKCQKFGTDKYKRSLMECFTSEGININREMVAKGYAVAYGSKYEEEEKQARVAKKGIWAGKFMRPELFRALKRKSESKR